MTGFGATAGVAGEAAPDGEAGHWKRMLETGEYISIAELAEREEIAPS
jgi:hypothetical protein